ncbi:MAG: sulfotransferase family protein [Spartobacteria bacterium]
MAAKVICVWGMHRSGTSCVTGVLQDWGVFLGEVRTESAFNARGNRENPDVRRLNDDVLKTSGGSWHELPPRISWSDEQRRRRDAILASYRKHDLWGFKDPRLLFTLAGWMESLPALHFVGTFRHPILVARSLEKRNQFPLTKGIALWQRYNERLLDYHRQFQFPILSFDRAEADYRQSLEKLLTILTANEVPLKESGISFFAEELRHTEIEADAELPAETLQLYRELQKLAL